MLMVMSLRNHIEELQRLSLDISTAETYHQHGECQSAVVTSVQETDSSKTESHRKAMANALQIKWVRRCPKILQRGRDRYSLIWLTLYAGRKVYNSMYVELYEFKPSRSVNE